jgi:hypothetical protein
VDAIHGMLSFAIETAAGAFNRAGVRGKDAS